MHLGAPPQIVKVFVIVFVFTFPVIFWIYKKTIAIFVKKNLSFQLKRGKISELKKMMASSSILLKAISIVNIDDILDIKALRLNNLRRRETHLTQFWTANDKSSSVCDILTFPKNSPSNNLTLSAFNSFSRASFLKIPSEVKWKVVRLQKSCWKNCWKQRKEESEMLLTKDEQIFECQLTWKKSMLSASKGLIANQSLFVW